MKLVDIRFKLCEELLDTIMYFMDENGAADSNLVYKSIGKTETYVKKAILVLKQLDIIELSTQSIHLNEIYWRTTSASGTDILRDGILNFKPLHEYNELLVTGKPKSSSLKIVKAVHNIHNDLESIGSILGKYKEYLQKDTLTAKSSDVKVEINTDSIKAETTQSASIKLSFVNLKRIEDLRKCVNIQYDLSKLIKVCDEVNDAYFRENYYSVGLLVRVILDHIPPIFNKRTFSEVANNHGSKSFKDVMINLENFNRKIADGFLHSQIKRKESLPNHITVDCRNAIDILLGEVISELN